MSSRQIKSLLSQGFLHTLAKLAYCILHFGYYGISSKNSPQYYMSFAEFLGVNIQHSIGIRMHILLPFI
jgi:hypothetical protein